MSRPFEQLPPRAINTSPDDLAPARAFSDPDLTVFGLGAPGRTVVLNRCCPRPNIHFVHFERSPLSLSVVATCRGCGAICPAEEWNKRFPAQADSTKSGSTQTDVARLAALLREAADLVQAIGGRL